MITWYLFWEMMAVSSTFLVLARNTEASRLAAQRYILVHLAGGLVLLAGILMAINSTGSIAFTLENIHQNSTAKWLILIGIPINAAAVPFFQLVAGRLSRVDCFWRNHSQRLHHQDCSLHSRARIPR